MTRKPVILRYTVLALLLLNLTIAPTPSEAQQGEKVEWQKPRPFLGAQPTLVLMVDFTDVRFGLSTSQVEQIAKTVDNFIRGSSYGKTWLEYYIHPKVIKLPKPMTYYSAPGSGDQRGDNYERITEYHLTVIKYAKERERIDLTRFKHVIVVHAGSDEAASGNPNDIWSHCNCVPPKILEMLIEQYGFDTVESELRRQGYSWVVDLFMHRRPDGSGHLLSGIETVAEEDMPSVMMHEFTHSMWISDHYVYSKDGYSVGSEVGVWTNMDYGPFLDPPVDIDGWSKYLLGWVEPIEVKGSGEYTIHTLDKKDEPHALIIPINDEEYYFMHARRPQGQDAALPGPGVLLFRINKYVDRNVEGEPFFIRLFDANPNTPPECRDFSKEAVRLCEGLDAPFYSDRGYRGSFGRFAINLLTSEFTSDEGWVFKVIDFDESAGVARISINLGSQLPTTTQTETRTDTATTRGETRTVTRTVTGTVIQTVYTTQTVIGETTTTLVVTVTTAPPPRQAEFTDYISIAIVLAALLAAMALIITRRGRERPLPPPPPPPYR
jgi:M6 family metalloprotease-like protein